ncbi:hypothetical protein CR194_03985 [Salipaludibacillus keqinensis]|uniref:Uncharacterized protein n=1 Tax=Salipaludibacillus keqinensis TaxID=2045207 RepID=A0A323TJG7_9BACI|nr:hypothetical protein CR194_03985 [Salipaludibacillus keqinensis]
MARAKHTAIVMICTVCSSPLKVPLNQEKEILIYNYVICPVCKQKNRLTKQIKLEVEKKGGGGNLNDYA